SAASSLSRTRRIPDRSGPRISIVSSRRPLWSASRRVALISALQGYSITAKVAGVQAGTSVDRSSPALAPGTKVKQVTALQDDLALALAAETVRVLPIPGTKLVGVEVPAAERQPVNLSDLSDALDPDDAHPLRFPVGVAVDGKGVSARLDKLPHILVAGQTGSGKSVFTTATLAHLVTHADPNQLRLILIDPKRVELASFAGIRHLARPVATDVQEAVKALGEAVAEMSDRWRILEEHGKRNISELDDPPPYLVVVVDELADLMMTAGKAAEAHIVRLLQLGRAAGVHLILATQRQSTDVITGLNKTNTANRICIAMSPHTDSNVALGVSGAERLLGQGDALWFPAGASQPERVQGAFLSTEDLDEMMEQVQGSSLEPEEIKAEDLNDEADPVSPDDRPHSRRIYDSL